MKITCILFAGAATVLTASTAAKAQTTALADVSSTDGDIVVTARKRAETLLDVPVAATVISGDTLAARNINSVKEAALLSPGLNINGDGAGRAFIAMRGVGVTLVSTVQPGVGLFIDGIYQPNTSYLNNPLVDVDRIEVLRGPQGTLYGKNSLGGAINIISRVPTDALSVRGSASYAGPDNAWTVAGSVSGALVPDKVQARLGFAHRQQDGFLYNPNTGRDANALATDSLNGMLRFVLGDSGAVLTVKGYYDWIDGINSPYSRVAGPTDYARIVPFNARNRVVYKYRGTNAKLELPIEAIDSALTLVGAYDIRDGNVPDSDGDFSASDFIRSNTRDRLRTKTAELRLDSKWNDTLSTLFGLFFSREEMQTRTVDNIKIRRAVRITDAHNSGDTYAMFGTIFWKPMAAWELALGMRYDHEDRVSRGSVVTNGSGGALPDARITSDEVEPRLSVTRHWSGEFMTYASVARGYRGGGFNAPSAPNRTYRGDFAWTYEVGSRYIASDRSLSLSGALFYNDYRHYIGLNSIAPILPRGFVTVDLNSGTVRSYGVEIEATLRPLHGWAITAGGTWMRARLTDSREYTATTGRLLSSDRLTFQPDWTFNIHTDYTIALGKDALVLGAGLSGKGKRLAATLNQTVPTFLDPYYLADASVTYRTGPFAFAVFGANLFNERYFDSYIEKTTLALAGLAPSDVGIIGDRGRYGMRAGFTF